MPSPTEGGLDTHRISRITEKLHLEVRHPMEPPRASKVGSRPRGANPFLSRNMGRKIRATLIFC